MEAKLLDRARGAIRARHYRRRTEEAYVHWIRRFIVFHGKRHPRDFGAAEMAAFLRWLAVERHVAASTQNQALSGVLFLYRDVLRVDIGVIDHVPRARTPVKYRSCKWRPIMKIWPPLTRSDQVCLRALHSHTRILQVTARR